MIRPGRRLLAGDPEAPAPLRGARFVGLAWLGLGLLRRLRLARGITTPTPGSPAAARTTTLAPGTPAAARTTTPTPGTPALASRTLGPPGSRSPTRTADLHECELQ